MLPPAAETSETSPRPLPPMPMQATSTRSLAPRARAGRIVKAKAAAAPLAKSRRVIRVWLIVVAPPALVIRPLVPGRSAVAGRPAALRCNGRPGPGQGPAAAGP